MRVVCDTNVIVSSFLNPYGASAKIVELLLEGKLHFCYDARILAEYEEVLTRPRFRIPPVRIRHVLEVVRLDGEVISATGISVKLLDHDDVPFLAARAECLITENTDDFKTSRSGGIPIFAPARFLDRYPNLFK